MINLNNVLFIFVFSIALIVFSYNLTRFFLYLKIGKGEIRTDKPSLRLKRVLTIAFGQTKLLREPVAGMMHLFIFWGFVILLTAVFESIGEGFNPNFSLAFLGWFYKIIIISQEFIALVVILSVLYAIYRRAIIKPIRLQKHSSAEAYIILVMILTIMLSMYFQNSIKLLIHSDEYSSYRFISASIAPIFSNIEHLKIYYTIFWWIHIGVVLVFLNLLPFSKHFHIITSIPNVYFSKLTPYGKIKNLNLNDETLQKFGASDVEDLTWKQLFDGYACTECGRCTASCPANITGKLLSPREIIINIRKRLVEKAPLLLSQSTFSDDEKEILNKNLVGGYISEEELWACTTCLACVTECPVMIEHVDHIVDMRRYLVLNESRFPKELQLAFQNLERNYNPWSFSSSSRSDWVAGMNVPILSEQNEQVDILFWVGCAGAFDERAKKVSKAIVKILNKANVKYAILGNEEKCTGDFARRAGNEYLAQMLINENVSTLNKYNIKKILTACPHCYNTLKNEYPVFGGNYEVFHHSEYIASLLQTGKIKVSKSLTDKIVYHDSCYLGRYNGIYDQPRKILKSISANLIEMKRNRDKGLCCGAGGARMFMEENVGKRINHERTDEAISMNTNLISTACPFCLTMISDGVKDRQKSEEISVKDIAELVADALLE